MDSVKNHTGTPFLVSEANLERLAVSLANKDIHLKRILEEFGPPPLWNREPGFATLLQIILEQQVSLASAKACFDKLKKRIRNLTPQNFVKLSDSELKSIGFSRQKTAYCRHLAGELIENRLNLTALEALADSEVKSCLMTVKGIGNWTSDIYLLMALRRPDVMPGGDLALHTAWHRLSGEKMPEAGEFIEIANRWRPYRSVAARMLWHFYLSRKKNNSARAC